jgi:hypothetical protein
MQHQALQPVAVAVLSCNAKIIIQNIFVLLAYFTAEREKIVWLSAEEWNVFDRIERLGPVSRIC